jgi:hypothetical protein
MRGKGSGNGSFPYRRAEENPLRRIFFVENRGSQGVAMATTAGGKVNLK